MRSLCLIHRLALSFLGALLRTHYSCVQQASRLFRIPLTHHSATPDHPDRSGIHCFQIPFLVVLAAILRRKTVPGQIQFP